MSLNDRYNPAAFSDEEDEYNVATPMYTDGPVVKLKFVWYPKTCSLTKKRLWLTTAYKSVERYYYNNYTDDEIIYTHWIDKHEYIIWKLTNG